MKRDLFEISAQAGEDGFKPDPVVIPKRWLPGFIRFPIKLLFLPFVLLDLTSKKIAKKIIRPPYQRGGSCKKRGSCCYYITMQRSRGPLRLIHRIWATQINGFYFRNIEVTGEKGRPSDVMGCRYLKKDGSCGDYRFRPIICREWPIISHFGSPRILKGCGFTPKATKKGVDPLQIL